MRALVTAFIGSFVLSGCLHVQEDVMQKPVAPEIEKPIEVPKVTQETAQRLFKEGRELSMELNFSAALVKLQESFELDPNNEECARLIDFNLENLEAWELYGKKSVPPPPSHSTD